MTIRTLPWAAATVAVAVCGCRSLDRVALEPSTPPPPYSHSIQKPSAAVVPPGRVDRTEPSRTAAATPARSATASETATGSAATGSAATGSAATGSAATGSAATADAVVQAGAVGAVTPRTPARPQGAAATTDTSPLPADDNAPLPANDARTLLAIPAEARLAPPPRTAAPATPPQAGRPFAIPPMDGPPRAVREQAAPAPLMSASHAPAADPDGSREDPGTAAPGPSPDPHAVDPMPIDDPDAAAPTSLPTGPIHSTEPSAPAPATVVAPDPAHPLDTVQKLVDASLAFYRAHPRYTVRCVRQERVGRRLGDRELLLMHFRNEPMSVHIRWLDPDNAGRECVFAEHLNDGDLVTLGGKGDFLMTGRQICLDPDGRMATSRSRYGIRESGLIQATVRLAEPLAAVRAGDDSVGRIEYRGLTRHPDLAGTAHRVVYRIPPGYDPALPDGAVRHFYFDAASSRLSLVISYRPGMAESEQSLLEYYLFDRFVPNPGLTDADFDADTLWGD